MLEVVGSARDCVAINLYLFESGVCAEHWIEVLCALGRKGVRVYLLLDDFGCLKLDAGDRDRLRSAGILIEWFNPVRMGRGFANFLRDHRKMVWVDGRVAFTGGFGFTDDFDPDVRGEGHWHEVALEVDGPCIGDWADAFQRDWLRVSGHAPLLSPVSKPVSDGSPGRVALNRLGHRRETRRSVLVWMRHARQRVWISTAYFLPPVRLRRELVRAARRGVDVRLLLPGPATDHPSVRRLGWRYYGRLLRNGVRIFEYQPRCLHAKVLMCDDWVSIGSSNLDHWTLRWTLDANQEIVSSELAQQVVGMFVMDFSESIEQSLASWRGRPMWHRIQERLVGWVHGALTLLSVRRRMKLEIARRRATGGRWSRPGP
jgi:phosphatidylserine/phosphatidylglycerophosphate/cardiolipin synthase-like enzyme